LYQPKGILYDSTLDAIIIADTYNNRIRKLTSIGNLNTVTTLAGSTSTGATDGTSSSAQFNYPEDVAVLGDYIYVADNYNYKVRKISLTNNNYVS
jgi:hypothetical protein